jgi:glycosyltransferase involved in cell wall biosynthesis
MANKIKAFPVYVSNSGCDYHRVRLPFVCGGQYYDHQAYAGFKVEDMLLHIAKSDVVVMNRCFPIGLDKLVQLKAENRFKVIVDLDDWWELPSHHLMYAHYKNVAAKEIIGCIQLADAITVTTDRLADRVRVLNRNVHVIPNALPYGHGQFADRPVRHDDQFNFIYTGQSSHLQDVRTLINPFNRVKQLPGIGFHLAGYHKAPVWDQIERVFSCMPNYKRIQQRPLDDYMQVYDQADCSIVPLVDNAFNRHKSNLKLLEAAAKRLPVICSNVPPYSDCQDAPVLWVKKQSDWFEHMRYLSSDRQAAIQMGNALYKWATEKYDLFKWNQVRFDLYKTVVNGTYPR